MEPLPSLPITLRRLWGFSLVCFQLKMNQPRKQSQRQRIASRALHSAPEKQFKERIFGCSSRVSHAPQKAPSSWRSPLRPGVPSCWGSLRLECSLCTQAPTRNGPNLCTGQPWAVARDLECLILPPGSVHLKCCDLQVGYQMRISLVLRLGRTRTLRLVRS